MWFLNTDRILRSRLILEENGLDIEYIQGKKNIVAYALSRFLNNGNQKTTKNSNYTKETMSEINDIVELHGGISSISLKLFNQYQWKYPSLMDQF